MYYGSNLSEFLAIKKLKIKKLKNELSLHLLASYYGSDFSEFFARLEERRRGARERGRGWGGQTRKVVTRSRTQSERCHKSSVFSEEKKIYFPYVGTCFFNLFLETVVTSPLYLV
jgi:hypothetical protein